MLLYPLITLTLFSLHGAAQSQAPIPQPAIPAIPPKSPGSPVYPPVLPSDRVADCATGIKCGGTTQKKFITHYHHTNTVTKTNTTTTIEVSISTVTHEVVKVEYLTTGIEGICEETVVVKVPDTSEVVVWVDWTSTEKYIHKEYTTTTRISTSNIVATSACIVHKPLAGGPGGSPVPDPAQKPIVQKPPPPPAAPAPTPGGADEVKPTPGAGSVGIGPEPSKKRGGQGSIV